MTRNRSIVFDWLTRCIRAFSWIRAPISLCGSVCARVIGVSDARRFDNAIVTNRAKWPSAVKASEVAGSSYIGYAIFNTTSLGGRGDGFLCAFLPEGLRGHKGSIPTAVASLNLWALLSSNAIWQCYAASTVDAQCLLKDSAQRNLPLRTYLACVRWTAAFSHRGRLSHCNANVS